MTQNVTSEGNKPRRPRSNQLFLEQGLKKQIEYAIALSHPQNPNPDHKLRYPNECDAKNVNRLKDITKRITHEHELYVIMLKNRIIKKHGPRRIDA